MKGEADGTLRQGTQLRKAGFFGKDNTAGGGVEKAAGKGKDQI